MAKIFISLTLLIISVFAIEKQVSKQKKIQSSDQVDYFRNPLQLQNLLAGNFGEIRPNHFHSGIDIKTNQREGYPIYAVADGYISRLRVQIAGFGNAVYVNHPNGITSVYGHLQKFNTKLAESIKTQQYKNQSFTVDFNLLPIEIPVKKGDIIAWSGNTGSSGGPHLHFELRNSISEETINPLTLGIKVTDQIKPSLNGLWVYDLREAPFNEFTTKKYYPVYGSNGNYTINGTILLNGVSGLGISAFDQQNGSANKNGLFSSTIKLDDEIIFETVIDKFAFEDSRAVNAFIDYPTKLKTGQIIQKGFTSPNPKVKFYTNIKDRGLLKIQDNNIHQVQYILKDYSGNTTTLRFQVKNNPIEQRDYQPKGNLMSHKIVNQYETDELKLILPEGILYDDLDFQFQVLAKPSNAASKIFKIHNRYTPVHEAYQLGIKIEENLMPLKDKLVMINDVGASIGGEVKENYLYAYPKNFGSFYLKTDETPPSIIPLVAKDGINLTNNSRITFKISDNLAGIKTFNGFVDGQWVLMEYDFKTGKLWHTLDARTLSGKHNFELVVTDNRENRKSYSFNFTK